MDKIFPEEIVNFSAEEHFYRNNVRGKPIYLFFVVLLLAIITSLPLIKLDITYSTRGILRTVEEPLRVIVPREGKVEFNGMKINKFVKRGDTLLILNHASICDEIADTQKALALLRNYKTDLQALLTREGIPKTVRYKQVFMEYTHEITRLESDYNFARNEYLTNKELYENGFIARMEFESIRRRYLSAEASIEVRKKEFQNKWQTELSAYTLQYLQFNTKFSHLRESKEMHIILAPISGYICDYEDLKQGSYLSPNEAIARIVPDQELVASCMVSPDKISRIREGQPVKLNIDAFPGSSYGRIEGKVETVPEDASSFSGGLGFPIICKISQEFGQNKYRQDADLKSGMTFTGLFIISRKSLWQLIIEKGEKLLIPTPSISDNDKIKTTKKVKQRDLTDCGPACVASIAAYYKTFIPVSQLRQAAGTDKKGTSALGLIKAFTSIGMSAKGVRCGIENLKNIPRPAIAHVVLKNGLHHYLVIYEIAKKTIRVMNPASGKIENLSLDTFLELWSGILIISAPGGEYEAVDMKTSNRKRFLYLIRPHKSVLFQAIIGALLYTLLGFSTSIYIQKLTDYIIVFQLKQALHISGILMLLLILIQQVFSAVKNKMILRTGQLIDARLILGYYKHLLKLPQIFFDSMRVGEIISRINDAGKIRQFVSDTLINIILNILIMVFSIVILFIFHWKLALLVSLILPAYIIIYSISNYLNRKQERILMEKSAELESQLVESIQNIRTVKQLNLEDHMSNEVEWRFIDLLKAGYKSGSNSIFANVSSETITRIFTLALLWMGAVFIFRNELTIGQMLSFYAILGYMSGPASRLIGINKIYQNANIAADRLFEIMDLEKPKNEGDIENDDFLKQDIEFKDVEFSYGTRGNLFSNFNIVIPGGEVTAIIGESGSGKSSLANLINGLYETSSGSISIGKHKICNYTKESLSKCIAIIPQHTDLFAGSILQNIAPGEIKADTERALEICYRLGLQSFLHSLPEGINTHVGEKGFTLSGGERQRISIARALYRNPSVLILDEATSSLDKETEARVMDIINDKKEAGRTVIIISHRLHSIIDADKIIMLEGGEVIEQGDHLSLLNKGGRYCELMKVHGTAV